MNQRPRVGFIQAIIISFKNYCNFRARSRRSEFWYFRLFDFIISSILITLLIVTAEIVETSRYSYPYVYYYKTLKFNPIIQLICSIYYLAVFAPMLSSCIRWLHDIGKSFVYLAWGFIPLIGLIILIVYFCYDSQPEENEYGPSPKYLTNEENTLSPLSPIQNSNNI